MGSSSGDSGGRATRGGAPAPPANMISPQGTATPYQPRFINFLEGSGPYTGLTPAMLSQIAATNGPAVPPPAAAAAAPPPEPERAGINMVGGRELLARIRAARNNPNAVIIGDNPGGGNFMGGMGRGNRGGWGGSGGRR